MNITKENLLGLGFAKIPGSIQPEFFTIGKDSVCLVGRSSKILLPYEDPIDEWAIYKGADAEFGDDVKSMEELIKSLMDWCFECGKNKRSRQIKDLLGL